MTRWLAVIGIGEDGLAGIDADRLNDAATELARALIEGNRLAQEVCPLREALQHQ